MKKMICAIWGLIMVAGCAAGISGNNISDTPTPPANYGGPIAEAPKFEVGEKWVFNNLTEKKKYSDEIIETLDDKIKVLREGDVYFCIGITERDRDFTVISVSDTNSKCKPGWKYLNFPL